MEFRWTLNKKKKKKKEEKFNAYRPLKLKRKKS